jgi:Recombination endonuclease VII
MAIAKASEATMKWRAANREEFNAYQRKWRRENPEKSARIQLKKLYGITPEQKADMLVAQGNVCAICKTDDPGKRGWVVDHCHTTRKVRGVLCANCNCGLGHFRDDKAALASAIAYLGLQ